MFLVNFFVIFDRFPERFWSTFGYNLGQFNTFFIMIWLVLNIRDLVVDLDISLFAHMFRGDDYFQRADTLVRVQTDDSDSKMSKSHEDT